MRDALLNLIQQTIVFEYDLPNDSKGIPKTIITTDSDKCYSANDMEAIKNIIYNSIVEYSFNEYELIDKDYQKLLVVALKSKLRYNEAADDDTKIKYGFFGEVLLYSILHILLGVKPLIARGYFYNPLENTETKGYDSYHLLERGGNLELWFGETKFHKNYKSGIDDVLRKIENAISDDYLDKNIIAIVANHKNNLNVENSQIENVINEWESNPEINVCEQLKKHNIKLVYPILILFEGEEEYDNSIKQIPLHISDNYTNVSFNLSVEYSIFFILLPLNEVKQIKSDVISWIESKKVLMS
ncbi:MAG: DUF1837 domain-containing protein [Ignavibacteriales bacterium]|nr:DUF1837 domain-containing protein [Ignavibacteriales bacterium]